MSENKDLRRRGQKNKSNLEQSADIPMMATSRPGTRTTGASKILLDDHVHEALQNKRDDERKHAQTNFYVSDEDDDEEQYVSYSSRPMKTQKIDTVPSPWMLNKTSITGETNIAFIGDAQTEDEAIQSKALPWRREDDMGEGYSKIQEEFPPWIKNQDSPYESPTNTLMGVSKHNSEVPSVLGFYRKDSQASVSADGSASRRNSELEMQHHASLNEADMENRRQKRSLRQFQRKNTQGNSITESDTIPEDETIQSSTNNTKL